MNTAIHTAEPPYIAECTIAISLSVPIKYVGRAISVANAVSTIYAAVMKSELSLNFLAIFRLKYHAISRKIPEHDQSIVSTEAIVWYSSKKLYIIFSISVSVFTLVNTFM